MVRLRVATEASGDDAAADKDLPNSNRRRHLASIAPISGSMGAPLTWWGRYGGGGRSACMVTSTSSIAAVRHAWVHPLCSCVRVVLVVR